MREAVSGFVKIIESVACMQSESGLFFDVSGSAVPQGEFGQPPVQGDK
jgi:hypothetical protein